MDFYNVTYFRIYINFKGILPGVEQLGSNLVEEK